MKAFTLLTLIAVGIAAFLSYEKGQLASFHPLLDPANRQSGEDTAEPAAPSPKEESAAEESATAKTSEPSPQVPAEPSPDQLKAEKLEQKRLEEEAAAMAKQEERAMREAARAEKIRMQTLIKAEIKELDRQANDILAKINQAEQNRSAQERTWMMEKIKSSEAEKTKLRQASAQYISTLRAQVTEINNQIRAKRKELFSRAR